MFLCTKKITAIPAPTLTFMLKDFLSSTTSRNMGENIWKADIEVSHLFSLCQWKGILSVSPHGNLETNWQHDAETLSFSPSSVVKGAVQWTDAGSTRKEATCYTALVPHKATVQQDIHQNNLRSVLDWEG